MMIRLWKLLLLSLLLLVSSPCYSQQNDKISPDLQRTVSQLAPDQNIDIIAYLRNTSVDPLDRKFLGRQNRPHLLRHLRKNSQHARKNFLQLYSAVHPDRLTHLWAINALAFSVPVRNLDRLAQNPHITRIVSDTVIHLSTPPAAAPSAPPWNMSLIQAPDLWAQGFDGNSVVIAALDSGVDLNHAALGPNWRSGAHSWFDPYGQHPLLPYDATGHGTAVMGILAGARINNLDIGVAPRAQWIAVKIFNDNNDALFSKIHEGFQWLLDPDSDPNTNDSPDVVNNSWGIISQVNQCNLEFENDIRLLKTAGIAVVFAAGNEGPFPSTSISPANNPAAFSVGSISSTSTILFSSSRGPSACTHAIFPDLVAPGLNIITADLTAGGAFPNAQTAFSGTSAAAPHLAAAMALLLHAFPCLDIPTLENVLRQSAADLGDPGPDNTYGAGLLQIHDTYTLLNQNIALADLDSSGFVDSDDLIILSKHWLHAPLPPARCPADINHDHRTNLADFTLLSSALSH